MEMMRTKMRTKTKAENSIMRRGLVLSLDALVAFLVFSSAIAVLYLFEQSFWAPELIQTSLQSTAQEATDALSRLRVVDVRREPAVAALFDSGTLSDDDLNRTLDEVIGSFWAVNNTGNASIAANLARALFAAYIPENANWALDYADEAVYNSSDLPSSGFVASSRKLVSGIAKGAPPTGCVASAYLQQIAGKSEAAYYYFGGFVGEGNLTVVLSGIPLNASISSIFLELNANDNFTLYANGVNCGLFNNVSSGNYSVMNWSITNTTCLNAIVNGSDNNFTIAFNGTQMANQFVGGGFIKVSYNTTSFATQPSNSKRQYFPGINGVINYYDTFYVPGTVSSVNARLHFYNNYTTNFTIGNKTVFNSSGSDVDQLVLLNNASFAALFNYSADLSEKNVPMKLWAYANVTGGIPVDVILITDVSGSMGDPIGGSILPGCSSSGTHTYTTCNNACNYSGRTQKLWLAECIDGMFVDRVLNISGNRVGLVNYSETAPVGWSVNLTSDSTRLHQAINNYATNDTTCICCAINRAYKILNETPVYYDEALILRGSAWNYTAAFPTATPPLDAQGRNWTEVNYSGSGWGSGAASLGFPQGAVTTNIGSNLVTLVSATLNASEFKNVSGDAQGIVSNTWVEDGVTLNLSVSQTSLPAQTWIGQFTQAGNSNSQGNNDRFTRTSAYAIPPGVTRLLGFAYAFGSGNGRSITFKLFRQGTGPANNYSATYVAASRIIPAGNAEQFLLPTPVSVTPGDYVGFRVSGNSNLLNLRSGSGNTSLYTSSDLGFGQSTTFSTQSTNQYHTVGALVEKDLPIEAWFNSSQVPTSFNVTGIFALIKFNSTTANNYSMLIFNYNTSSWESSNCSSAVVTANANTTFYCNKTENVTYYLSSTRNITVALNKTSGADAATRLRIDLVRFDLVEAQGDYYFRKKFSISNSFKLNSLINFTDLFVYSDDRADVYVNGNLVDSDSVEHAAAYWNRVIRVPKTLLRVGDNVVAVRLRNNDNVSAKFDLELNASYVRKRFVVTMTDGIANVRCTNVTSTCSSFNEYCQSASGSRCYTGNETDPSSAVHYCNSGTLQAMSYNAPANNTIYSACRTATELNTTIHAVGFGISPTEFLPNATLAGVARCGNGNYTMSTNASELAEFYEYLAKAIVQGTGTQVLETFGEVNSILYPDSWLDFSFTPDTPNYGYQEMSVDLETPKFPSCQGSFNISNAMRVDEFRASSYSGEYWTDNATLNNGTGNWAPFFNLSIYGQNYTNLGDPFILWANPSLIKNGTTNYISIRTGNSSIWSNPNCSSWNQGFYKARVHAAVNYSNVFLYCKARNATVYYDLNYDGVADGNVNVSVGSNLPSAGAAFVPPGNFSADNAVDDAFQRLLNNLDFDSSHGGANASGSSENPISIKLSDSVSSQVLIGQGIPFAWGPTEASIVVWGKT